MIRKIVSVVLALCMLGCCLILSAAAQEPVGRVSLKLNSDVAGHTDADYSAFITVVSGNVRISFHSGGPVYASDYAGTTTDEALVAGRTYYVDYLLEAEDGFALPDAVNEDDIEIECGKGVTVFAKQIVVSHARTDNGFVEDFRGLRIQARVLVDGNEWQRLIGWFYDLILKIRAWSLY